MRIDVLGIGFDNLTPGEAVDQGLSLIKAEGGAYVVTPNPEIVWMCRKDEEFKTAVQSADMVLADGVGIVHGAKILKTPLKSKVPGIDFAMSLMGQMAKEEMSVFLLGAGKGVAEEAAKTLQDKFPGLKIVGTQDGYFKDGTPIISRINELRPDLTLVCLGAKKQECWMYNNKDRLQTGLMAGLGGTLDVLAGNVQRAPEKWQKMGLEWLYRLIKEPRRIGRMMKLPLFLFAVIGKRFKRGK